MSGIAAPDYAPLDEAEYKRQARLLKALHCAYPVQVEGCEQFVHVLHARQAGGRIEMDVWLSGSSAKVDPTQITLGERAR